MKEASKSTIKRILFSGFIAIAVLGCNNADTPISFSHNMITVRRVRVGDSISSSFMMHNNTNKQLTVSFLPDCDCTTINPERVKLAPHERGKLLVKVNVDSTGEFIKYVYAQVEGSDVIMILKVKGVGK